MPRLFIAIRFDDAVKRSLVAVQHALRLRGVTGRFCAYGNLHMTLAFIGENYDMAAIRAAVGEVRFEPFTFALGRLGTFPTKAGVIWCGVAEGDEAIRALAEQLRERLRAHGVRYSTVGFLPHISLVQAPSSIVTDVEIPASSMRVERISIMKSERIDGELVYSEVF